MSIKKKLAIGFMFIVGLNYIMPVLINNLFISVKVFGFDISSVIIAIMVSILNLIGYAILKIISGLEGNVMV